MTITTLSDQGAIKFASLKLRLLCMIYEAVLLFGVVFAAGILFDVITNSKSPFTLHEWRQLYLFIVLGIYFTYFWGHGGQTLPMQTWHIRVVSVDGHPVSFKQACLRYVFAWMWFLPSLALNYVFHIQNWPSIVLIAAGMIGWALTSKFDPDGQFLHDKLAKTQLITVPKKARESDTE